MAPDGNITPVSAQDDVAYRSWLANGGEGSYHEWVAQGKPAEVVQGIDQAPAGTVRDRNVKGPDNKFPDGIAFNSNIRTHISTVDGFSQKKGILGGHNLDAFNQAVADKSLKTVSSTKHPTIKGLIHIEYQIPALDRAGNITGYKNKIFEKTVYDPKFFSDEQILQLGQEAAAKGYSNALSQGMSQFSSEAGGVKFRIYIRNDIIDNLHPEF